MKRAPLSPAQIAAAKAKEYLGRSAVAARELRENFINAQRWVYEVHRLCNGDWAMISLLLQVDGKPVCAKSTVTAISERWEEARKACKITDNDKLAEHLNEKGLLSPKELTLYLRELGCVKPDSTTTHDPAYRAALEDRKRHRQTAFGFFEDVIEKVSGMNNGSSVWAKPEELVTIPEEQRRQAAENFERMAETLRASLGEGAE